MLFSAKIKLAALYTAAVLLLGGGAMGGYVVAFGAPASPPPPGPAAQSATLPATGQGASGQAIPSGLYTMTGEVTGPIVIQRADTTGEVGLTKQVSGQLRKASLISTSNDNSQYRLSLTAGPIPEGADQQRLALVLAGMSMPVNNFPRKADGSILVEGTVASQAAAEKIAAELNIKPQMRTHPGHRLLVTVKAQKDTYRPDETVTLVMTIKNVGHTDVRFLDGGSQRGPRNNQFGFTAFHNLGFGPALPDIGDPTTEGGKAGLPTLAPGDVFTKEVDLTKWFKLNEPDSYEITGMYHFTLLGEQDQPFRDALWDDFAVARCVVRVIAPPTTAPAVSATTQPAL